MGSRWWFNAGASAGLAGLLLCGAAPAAVPIGHFFDNTPFSEAKLSPSGRHLALRAGADGARRDGLVVMELDSGKMQLVAKYRDADIGDFHWVNDKRLVYNLDDRQAAQGDIDYAPGMYAADLDGSAVRQLAAHRGEAVSERTMARRPEPWNTYLMEQPGAQDSDAIYVLRGNWNSGLLEHYGLLRIDTRSGRSTVVMRPGPVRRWLLDAQGVPRLATTLEDGRQTVHYLDPATDAWRVLASFGAYGNAPGSFTPLGFSSHGKLYVSARAGQDKESLRQLDLATGALSADALVTLPAFDFSGKLVYSNGKLLGYEVLADGRTMAWLDEGMKAVQQAVDAQLPGLINLVTPPTRPQSPWMLVRSYSDQQPLVYLVYNTDTKKLRSIGQTRPDIKAADMAQRNLVQIKARDGLQVPAWLSLPNGGQRKLPMVVLVHGGPWVRGGELAWDAEVQFLASRGYAVLEPEFRGSTGYGDKHFRAGVKQWGLAMQDDVTDAAQWAVAQGIADPKRICIAGASYGGYATLMGLIKEPQLFKCGIDWVGVTDIELMYKEDWLYHSDLPDDWRERGMPALIGDPKLDAEQLKATSPLQQAHRVTQPLLMAYGSSDRRVPLHHGRQFHRAVRQHNAQAELVEYTNEGHGWYLPATRIDFWTRVEKFLARHIGAQAKTE